MPLADLPPLLAVLFLPMDVRPATVDMNRWNAARRADASSSAMQVAGTASMAVLTDCTTSQPVSKGRGRLVSTAWPQRGVCARLHKELTAAKLLSSWRECAGQAG